MLVFFFCDKIKIIVKIYVVFVVWYNLKDILSYRIEDVIVVIGLVYLSMLVFCGNKYFKFVKYI